MMRCTHNDDNAMTSTDTTGQSMVKYKVHKDSGRLRSRCYHDTDHLPGSWERNALIASGGTSLPFEKRRPLTKCGF